MCEQQYFLNYVLCFKTPEQKKAQKGSATHKALECLAWKKKCEQENVEGWDDDNFGPMLVKDCDPDFLIRKSYDYYVERTPNCQWWPRDFKDCQEWMWTVLNFGNGRYDPRNRKIIAPEQPFDFVIDKEWAKYRYELPNGVVMEQKLSMKGTMDLVTEVRPGIIEILDWKTGERIDWGTGKEKTYKKLCSDSQLMIYSYAANHIFPDYSDIILTIFFTRDGKRRWKDNGQWNEEVLKGGPFTVTLAREDLEKTEKMLEDKFNEIRNCKNPALTPHPPWSGLPSKHQELLPCTAFCHFGKTNWKNTGKNICQFIHEETQKKGMDAVMMEYGNIEKIGVYGNAAGKNEEDREKAKQKKEGKQ